VPKSPTILKSSKVSAYFANLNWTAPSDNSVIGFNIYQDGTLVRKTDKNSISIDHLIPATNYNFIVKSYNNSYLESAESNVLSILTYLTDTYAKDLIVTKYLEGTGNNKALEITNKTGHTVKLDSYSLSIQLKSPSSYYFADRLQLEGDIANNESFVVINSNSAFICYSTLQSKFVSAAPSLTFNGSNFLSLRYKSTIVDAIGEIDMDNFTILGNVSLYRLNNLTQPNSTFDITEWQKNPADYCENLGNLSSSERSVIEKNIIEIYPNPVTQSQIFAYGLNIKNINSANIFDLFGKLIMTEKKPFRTKNFINIEYLKTGIYILRLDNQSFKVVKN
jgi:hypothetical protein